MIELGDTVVIAVGKRQLAREHRDLRKRGLEVVRVDETSVVVLDGDDEVTLPLALVKPMPLSPGQVAVAEAEHRASEALRELKRVLRERMGAQAFALVEDRIRGLSVIYAPSVQAAIVEKDRMGGWEP